MHMEEMLFTWFMHFANWTMHFVSIIHFVLSVYTRLSPCASDFQPDLLKFIKGIRDKEAFSIFTKMDSQYPDNLSWVIVQFLEGDRSFWAVPIQYVTGYKDWIYSKNEKRYGLVWNGDDGILLDSVSDSEAHGRFRPARILYTAGKPCCALRMYLSQIEKTQFTSTQLGLSTQDSDETQFDFSQKKPVLYDSDPDETQFNCGQREHALHDYDETQFDCGQREPTLHDYDETEFQLLNQQEPIVQDCDSEETQFTFHHQESAEQDYDSDETQFDC